MYVAGETRSATFVSLRTDEVKVDQARLVKQKAGAIHSCLLRTAHMTGRSFLVEFLPRIAESKRPPVFLEIRRRKKTVFTHAAPRHECLVLVREGWLSAETTMYLWQMSPNKQR